MKRGFWKMKWQILEVKNGVNKGWVGFRKVMNIYGNIRVSLGDEWWRLVPCGGL